MPSNITQGLCTGCLAETAELKATIKKLEGKIRELEFSAYLDNLMVQAAKKDMYDAIEKYMAAREETNYWKSQVPKATLQCPPSSG